MDRETTCPFLIRTFWSEDTSLRYLNITSSLKKGIRNYNLHLVYKNSMDCHKKVLKMKFKSIHGKQNSIIIINNNMLLFVLGWMRPCVNYVNSFMINVMLSNHLEMVV